MSIGQSTNGDPAGIVPGGESFNAPVDIHGALAEVRRLNEFAPSKPDWLGEALSDPLIKRLVEGAEKSLQGLLDAVGQMLARIRPAALDNLPDNILSLFSGFIGFLIILVLMYGFYVLLGWFIARRGMRTQPPLPAVTASERLLLVNAGHHHAQAQAHAKAQRYDAAVRELYLASLCLLDQTRAVAYDPSLTNRAYLAALQSVTNQSVRPAFAHLSGAFEAVRYGARPMDANAWAEALDRYQRLSQWALQPSLGESPHAR